MHGFTGPLLTSVSRSSTWHDISPCVERPALLAVQTAWLAHGLKAFWRSQAPPPHSSLPSPSRNPPLNLPSSSLTRWPSRGPSPAGAPRTAARRERRRARCVRWCSQWRSRCCAETPSLPRCRHGSATCSPGCSHSQITFAEFKGSVETKNHRAWQRNTMLHLNVKRIRIILWNYCTAEVNIEL